MSRRDIRQQIMYGLERLFTSRRFHEITLEDVAKEAQVGKGTIYRYFQNKDDLFFNTVASGFDDLCELLRKNVPENAPFYEKLLSACVEISSFFDRRRQLFGMMQIEERRMYWCKGNIREKWTTRHKKLVAAVAEIIGKGVAEGQIRPDIPAEVLASFLLAMLRTRAHTLGDAPKAMLQHELLLDLFCRGAGRGEESTKKVDR